MVLPSEIVHKALMVRWSHKLTSNHSLILLTTFTQLNTTEIKEANDAIRFLY